MFVKTTNIMNEKFTGRLSALSSLRYVRQKKMAAIN